MSNVKQFAENIIAERTYIAEAAISAGQFVVGGTASGTVALPAAANAAGGKGVALNDAAIGQPVSVAYLGIARYRKASGVVAEDAALTISATAGALTASTAGQRIYAVSCVDSTSTEEYGYCQLMPGFGVLTLPGA